MTRSYLTQTSSSLRLKFQLICLILALTISPCLTHMLHQNGDKNQTVIEPQTFSPICNHDELMERYPGYVVPQDSQQYNHPHRRMLQATQPIRITMDFTPLDTLTNSTQKQYFIDQMTVVQTFFEYMIKVNPLAGNNIYPSYSSTCFVVTPSATDRSPGIPSSDLHLYITWENAGAYGFAANAGWCILNNGPRFGKVNFNAQSIAYNALKLTHKEFDRNIEITIHEVTHVLGFSGGSMQYWFQPGTSTYYGASLSNILTSGTTVRGISTTSVLKSPNVLQVARDHYGCPTLAGMLVENQGGSGSLGSHWERTILNNEVMNAIASNTDAYFSKFTVALLQDTNWYADVDMTKAEEIMNGKGKGCSWVTDACSAPSDEFCVSGAKQCDYHAIANGPCGNDQFMDTGCLYRSVYSNMACTSTEHPYNNSWNSFIKEEFISTSRCFASNFYTDGNSPSSYSTRCYHAVCQADGNIDIRVNGITVTCTTEGQVINAAAVGMEGGTLTCPNKDIFCFVKMCPNFCSSQGICVQGVCLCVPGYSGADCSTLGVSCHYSCSTCSGSASNQCTACPASSNRVATPVSGVCGCQNGFFDNGVAVCAACNNSCSTCDGSSSSHCLTCPASSNRISTPNGSKQCNCSPGFYENNVAVCPSCHYSCQTCGGPNSNQCATCKTSSNRVTTPNGSNECPCSNGFYENSVSVCPACHPSCLTCSGPSSSQCLSCPLSSNRVATPVSGVCACLDFFYHSGVQVCAACHHSCQTCNGSAANQCSACPTSSNRLATPNGSSQCLCNTNYFDNGANVCVQCHYSCSTCNAAGSSGCTACPASTNRNATPVSGVCACVSNFYDNGVATCQACHFSCQTCNGTTASTCLTCRTSANRLATPNGSQQCLCINGFYENNVVVCPQCHYSCATCSGPGNNQCLTCPTSTNRVSTPASGVCGCSDFFYDNGVATCAACHFSCKTCNGPNSNNCSSCPLSSNRIATPNASNQCLCSVGYQENNAVACTQCHFSCLTCSGPNSNQCLTCPSSSNRIATPSSGQCTCSLGYNDNGTSVCVTNGCHYSCDTCNGTTSSDCLTCPPESSNRVTTPVGGSCGCQDGFYDNSVITCPACHHSCETCSGPGSFQCTTCPYDANRNDNSYYDYVCPCTTHYYDIGVQVCSACHFSCEDCSGGNSSTNCTTCPWGSYRLDTPNGSGQCLCLDGYFQDVQDGINVCSQCHHSCATCTSAADTSCLTCKTSANRLSTPSSGQCSCLVGYFDNAEAVCPKCHFSCSECDGPAATNCTACPSSSHRVAIPVDGQCDCDTGFYEKNITLCSANPCHYTCQECTGPNEDECTACPVSSNRISSPVLGQCACLTSFFNNGITICQSCHYSCQNCQGSTEYDCTSCQTDMNRYYNTDDGNTCPCSSCIINQPLFFISFQKFIIFKEFYDNGAPLCLPCHSICNNCSGPSQEQCIDCNPDHNREQGEESGLCECRAHFYQVGTNQYCPPCHESCFFCDGPNSNQCTACLGEGRRVDNSALPSRDCPCEPRTYSIGHVCTDCHYSCESCNGDYETDCTACPDTLTSYRIDNSATTHDCPCIEGYFENSEKNCEACHVSCSRCSGPAENECTACPASSNRLSSPVSNQCDCLPGFYHSGVQVCSSCHYSCGTCSLGNANNQCDTCPNSVTTYRVDNSNINKTCPCQVGYANTGVQICSVSDCHYSCLTCSGVLNNQCLTCSADDHRSLSGNYCISDDGFYDDGSNGMSLPCHHSCQTCNGPNPNQCLSCPVGAFRIDNSVSTHTCPCNINYYDNSVQVCASCHHSCASCNGGANTNCLTCPTSTFRIAAIDASNKCGCLDGYYENGVAVCATCHYSCLTCSAATSNDCLTCPNPTTSFRTDNSATTHSCPCNSGFLDNMVKICLACSVTCSSCSGPNSNECLTCPVNSTTYRLDNANLDHTCPCQEGYYHNNVQICAACHYSCKKCSSGTNTDCVSCDASLYRSQIGNQCTCMDGYFDDGTPLCQKCDPSCQTCSGATSNHCLTCNLSNHRIYNGSNQCLCESGYYDGGLPVCNTCHYSCLACTGQGSQNCQSCPTGVNRIASPNANKECLCTSGFNDFGVAMCNGNCHFSCQSCSGPNANNCLSCPPASNRKTTNLASLHTCDCEDGFYQQGTTIACSACHFSCQTCSGPLATECLSCDSVAVTHRIDNAALSHTCPCQTIGFFQSNVKNCSVCHYSCSECTGTSQNNCTTCPANRVPGPSNSCICPSNTYDDGTAVCKPCHYSCSSCNGPSLNSCTACAGNRISGTSSSCVCSPAFYDDGTVNCKPCNYQCATCSGSANNCVSCATTGTNRSTLTPSCNCLDSFYDSGTAVCAACNYTCQTCSGSSSSNCLTCNLPDKRNLAGSQCPCDQGYYDQNVAACANCHPTCQKCNGSSINSCTSCAIGRILAPSGQCNCVDGFYNDISTDTCQPCDYSCQTCSGPSNKNCLSCVASRKNQVDIDGTCPCNEGTKDIPQKSECSICHYSCSTCSGTKNTDCLSCRWEDKRRHSSTEQTCRCNPNHYEQGDGTSLCYRCHEACGSCDGPLQEDCITCSIHYSNYFKQCVQECPSGFYTNQPSNKCEICDQECAECQDQKDRCTMCNNPQATLNSENKCVVIKVAVKYDAAGTPIYYEGCHYSCKGCYIKNSYSNCFACVENRILSAGKRPYTNQCVCPQGYSDLNRPYCTNSKILTLVQGICKHAARIAASAALLAGAVNRNPIMAASQVDAMQQITYLQLINKKNSADFKQFSSPVALSHSSNLIQIPDQYVPKIDRGSSQSNTALILRNLATIEQDNSLDSSQTEPNGTLQSVGNDKIALDDKYTYFIINGISVIVLHIFSWVVSFCAQRMDPKKQIPNTWRYSLRNALYFTIPVQTLIFTTSESSLLLMYQFQNSYFDTTFDMISLASALIFSVYYIAFFSYLAYNLNKKEDQYQNDEDYQRKFNFFFSYFKGTASAKNFSIALMVRKLLFSAILVFIYKDPIIQISLTLFVYCMFWTYIVSVRPFKLTRYNVFSCIIETEMLGIHILFFLVANSDSESDDQVDYTMQLMYMILALLFTFTLIAIVQTIMLAYEWLTKKQKKDAENSELDENDKVKEIDEQKFAEKQRNEKKEEDLQVENVENVDESALSNNMRMSNIRLKPQVIDQESPDDSPIKPKLIQMNSPFFQEYEKNVDQSIQQEIEQSSHVSQIGSSNENSINASSLSPQRIRILKFEEMFDLNDESNSPSPDQKQNWT